MSDSDAEENEGGAAAPIHDASMRVDTRTLSASEQEFARMMGFTDDPAAAEGVPTAAPPPTTKASAPSPADSSPDETILKPIAVDAPTVSEAETSPDAALEVSAAAEEIAEDPAPLVASSPSDPAAARTYDWEEIHPRAATLGRQAALVERADRVAKLEPGPIAAEQGPSPKEFRPPSAPSVDVAPLRAQLQASEARVRELEATTRELTASLEAKEHALATRVPPAEPEKEADALQLELDGLGQERDRLGDALAAAHTARAEAESRAERLEAALRAARGPSGPVPEGDRALRAEVIGLRRRLEESGAESRRLRETVDVQATDLAIARAHRDDRQNEIDQLRERIDTLESERAAQVERLDEALARQRELLALVSRIQAENVELRSTQAALEETLEARDLEISAREEHLLVTRRGLTARDEQLIDAAERLEQARHRHELIEAELERARLGQAELEDKLLRREARITSLSKTLTRIEEAIGRPAAERSIPTSIAQTAPPQPTRTSERKDPPIASLAPPAAPIDAPAPLAPPVALPPALVAWRNEKIRALSGAATGLADFLARGLVDPVAGPSPSGLRILSLGGADPEAEVELAAALEALGVPAVSIHVIEADEAAAEPRRRAIESAGRGDSITIGHWHEDAIASDVEMDALLLGDALWHQPDPDSVLDRLASGLRADGVVLFVDRIAGGALELSPTTCEKLAELWQVLPESWITTDAFASTPSPGEDGGVVAPACDLLTALDARFVPRTTIGFGHIVDLAVGPTRGPIVSLPGSAAEAFLTSIDALDESRSIAEGLPPRHGVAIFVRREQGDAALAERPAEILGLEWAIGSR